MYKALVHTQPSIVGFITTFYFAGSSHTSEAPQLWLVLHSCFSTCFRSESCIFNDIHELLS